MHKNYVDAYNHHTAKIYQKYGRSVEIWHRSLYPSGAIFAYRVGDIVSCFAVTNDGQVIEKEHQDLILLFMK